MAANSGTAISPKAQEMITDCLRRNMTPRQVQTKLRKSFGLRITQDEITMRRERYEKVSNTKLFFKRKGADIVQEFLEKARGGIDVSDLETVLTNAVYLDLLRRYAIESDEINFKDLLKLTSDFRKTRIASLKAGVKTEKILDAKNAFGLLSAFGQTLQGDEGLKGAFEKHKEQLLETMKTFFTEEEFDSARDDSETMQKLAESYERQKRANSDN